MKDFFIKLINKIKRNPDILFYIFLLLYFVFMLFLSQFRDMIKDESLYFRETWLISELLKSGRWIGNYAVGLHGFLFKLPPAIVFIFTGPSVDIVTIYNIVLSILVGFFFYKFTREFLKNSWYALCSTVLLVDNFHFLLSSPTYLREIPSMLIIVIFMYCVLKKCNGYILSLVFLLLLDTKEYVFLVFILFYILWLFFTSNQKKFFRKLVEIFKRTFLVLIPSLIWIILMFCTGIIPVNMYFASIVGLIQDSLDYSLKHFSLDFTIVNLIEEGKTIPLINKGNITTPLLLSLIDFCNILISYVGKIIYPRTFSFLSVPKVVIFPVVFSSILVVKRYFKEKIPKIFLFSSILTLTWLLVYILRSSHGRYLLPVVGAISIMLIYVLFKAQFSLKQKKWMIAGTAIFVILGFLFESSYLIPKIVLEVSLLLLFSVCIFRPNLVYLKYIFLTLLIASSFCVAILFSYTQGQIRGYINWGENREAEKIAEIIPDGQKYWINNYDNQNLVALFKGETFSLVQWKWQLNEKIAQHRDMDTLGSKYGYNFYIFDMVSFKNVVEELGIKKVILIESSIKEEPFLEQEYQEELKKEEWIHLQDKLLLKGKVIYIFNVVKQ